MNVGRKLLMIVFTSVALVTIPAAGAIYYYTKNKMLTSESATLLAETKTISESRMRDLTEAENSLKFLSRMLKKSLSQPPQIGEEKSFDLLVHRDKDYAWRNQIKNVDGIYEAGIFLPPDALLDAEQKRMHLRSKFVLDSFSGFINSPFSNVWLLTPGKTEIIYDRGVPDFVTQMQADTDYTKTPWLTLGNPVSNPERSPRWTPPLFDPVPKSWMISTVLPVDVNGRWIGNVGHDIYLKNVFSSLFQQNQRYTGEQHFLLDTQGNYIYAGPWQKVLEANQGNYKPDLRNEPDLAVLLTRKDLSLQPHLYNHNVSFQGREYLAINVPMPVIGWQYTRLIPVDEVLAPMKQVFYALVAMVLSVGLLIGFLINTSVKHNIVNRLQVLANAVRRYGLGDLSARAGLVGNDEIAKTSYEFDAMAEQMKATLEAIPDLLFEIGLDGLYYAAHSPRSDLLAAPQSELIGRTIQDVFPPDAAEIVMSALREANEKGRSQGKQFELQVPQGKLWFELSVARKSVGNLESPRLVVLSRDITERKFIEKAREEALNRLQKIADRIPGVVYQFRMRADGSFCFPFASEALREIYRVSPADVREDASKAFEIIHPDDYGNVVASIQKSAQDLSLWRHEFRVRFDDGTVHWLLGNSLPECEVGGAILWHGFISDITERKRIEQDLIESEYRWKFAIEGSGDGVWDVNVQTNEASYSKRWKEMLGYTEDDILSNRKDWITRIHPEDQKHVLEAGQVYLEGNSDTYVVEYRLRCKDGSYKWMLSRGMLVSRSEDGRPLRMIGTQTEITMRKLAEEELLKAQSLLEQSHERYRDLYEFAPIGYLSISNHGMITEINWKATGMFGLKRSQLLQHRFGQFVENEDKGRWQRLFASMKDLEEGEELSFDMKFIREDGWIFNANLNCLRMDDVDENPMLRITLVDITERKLAEKHIENLLVEQKAMLENRLVGIVTVQNRKVVWANSAYEAMMGYEKGELVGVPTRQLYVTEKDYLAVGAAYADIESNSIVRSQHEFMRKDGNKIWLDINGMSLHKENGESLWIFVDATERRQSELKIERLKQLYDAISQCNQAIVRSVEESELLQQICHIAVAFGGMKMAWIGLVDEVSQIVIPVAFYGDDNEYLSGVQVSVDDAIPSGQGPTGTSIRENQPFWCQDFVNDPRTAPWHESGTLSGWAAMASLPLHRKGVAVGAFILYSEEVNAFDDNVRKLLLGMSADISYALDGRDREPLRKTLRNSSK